MWFVTEWRERGRERELGVKEGQGRLYTHIRVNCSTARGGSLTKRQLHPGSGIGLTIPEPLSAWFCQELGNLVCLADWQLSGCSGSRKSLKPQKQLKLCNPFPRQKPGRQSGVGVHCYDKSEERR